VTLESPNKAAPCAREALAVQITSGTTDLSELSRTYWKGGESHPRTFYGTLDLVAKDKHVARRVLPPL
jgi:hypothetical protein